MVWFFYNLFKFDTVNGDVPFYKKGHKSEIEAKSDLPTPKSEKTGGGPKKIWRLGKKPGGFGKMSHDLII